VSARIRPVSKNDAEDINAIYNHYVLETPITFDIDAITLEQRLPWIEIFDTTGRHQCVVAERDGRAIGWACSKPFRVKAAYETSVEMSIFLDPDCGGQGLGTALYETLFEALEAEDLRRAVAGITLPNAASLALHARFGFTSIGVFSEIGRKFDRYWDVQWLEKSLKR
jgi:phosphinothricin acetyltransferase